jgi:O-antigen biosynthesis protein
MPIDPERYRSWIRRYDTLDQADRTAAERLVRSLGDRPRFDVVVPVYNPPEAFLEEAIASVRQQIYPEWTLYLFDDSSDQPHVRRILERVAREDARIRVAHGTTNGGIAAATNAGLALGHAEHVFFLDHDDRLEPHALLMFAHELQRAPDANLIYSDVDILTEAGERSNPFFKPDYDPELLLAVNLTWGLFRRALLERLGGMRLDYPGSEDYDLVLRAAESVPEHTIRHIPHILGHWRMVPTSFSHTRFHTAIASARRAVRDHCSRRGLDAEVVEAARVPSLNRVKMLLPQPPAATLLVERVDPGEADPAAPYRHTTNTSGLRAIHGSGPQGESIGAARNRALRQATTDLVAFLDARLRPRSGDWLAEMAAHFSSGRCAAAGARVIGADGLVEHCGFLVGVREHASGFPVARVLHGAKTHVPGYFGHGDVTRRASVVGGGVLVVFRPVALELGGFDEHLADPLAVDIDFSLRARQRGFTLVTCPHAEFAASASAPWVMDESDRSTLLRRWGDELEADPNYNPNLTHVGAAFDLAFPPRVTFPWRAS